MSRTRRGYFLIADITGYTQYLSESELEHAQDTLTALLELLVKNTHPPLVISRLAGDAVISYGFEEDFLQGQSFIEAIEDIYVAFRKTIERLVLNNSCKCKACANITNLDLSESELEHAQDTLTALLELLVKNTHPPLVISRLAGDAVISYGFEENFFQGQSFIEAIEDIYVAFRKTIERLVLNNSCKCKACANITNLDLKFFVHYGTFGIQRISGLDELVGTDVNLIHRLLKNSVTEATGFRAYALYTDVTIRQLNLEAFSDVLAPHLEAYEHLGQVKLWIQDMHAVWNKKRAGTVIDFPTDGALMRMEVEINMPPERVWDYMIQPKFRNFMVGSNRMDIRNRSQGRISEGSIYECYHGDKKSSHIILEWTPFQRMIIREGLPLFPKNSVISESRVDAIEAGTRLTRSYAPVTGPFLGRAVSRIFPLLLEGAMNKALRAFKDAIESDYQAHRVSPDAEVKITEQRIREAAADSLQTSAKIKPA